MRKEYEQRLEELKKSAEEEVDERLDASVKRILAQNRRMAEELKIHVQVWRWRCLGIGVEQMQRFRPVPILPLKANIFLA